MQRGQKILLHPLASLRCHHWKQGEALDHAKLSLSPLRERRDEEIIWHKSGPTEDLNYRYEQSAVFKDMYRKYRKWVFSSQWKFPCRKQPWKEWGKEEKSVEGKKWRRKKRGFAVLNVQPAKYTGLVRYRYSDIYARWPKMVDVLDFIPVSASCLLLDPLWKTNIIYHSDQEVFRLGLKHEQSWKGNLQSVRLYLHSTFPRTDHNRNTRTSGL